MHLVKIVIADIRTAIQSVRLIFNSAEIGTKCLPREAERLT